MTIEQEIAEKAKEGLKPFIITFVPTGESRGLVWALNEEDAMDNQDDIEWEFKQAFDQPEVELDEATAEDIADLRRH